jgi:cellulose synthase/poly-beta-1,6-N-acetylglucosamine synthase-like glycosyltransferase
MAPYLADLVFWAALGLIGYTFAGYPLLIRLIAALRRKSGRLRPFSQTAPPTVSVVLCAHNEENRIVERLANLFATDYPSDLLEAVVVSDGSTDRTASRVMEAATDRLRLIVQPERCGKAHGLNRAVEQATGEIIVFADSRQRFEPSAIRLLAEAFADPKVGAVSGSLEIDHATSSAGKGIDSYWRLEKRLRRDESDLGATIGCTGAIYAIRKRLFRPLPLDTLLDDVVVPMNILVSGFRVTFEPRAIAFDPQALEPKQERIRKLRTLAGNYQMLFRYPEWMLPWKHRGWWQLISHKYLRLAAPWMLLLALVTNLALADHTIYRWLLAGQLSLYALGSVGLACPKIRYKAVSLPAGFLFLNLMAAASLIFYLRHRSAGVWQTTPAAASPLPKEVA